MLASATQGNAGSPITVCTMQQRYLIEPRVLMCGHGERAMGAASLLVGTGHHDLVVLDGGPQDWAAATGQQLETGG